MKTHSQPNPCPGPSSAADHGRVSSQSTRDTPCLLCPNKLFKGQIGLNAHYRIMHQGSNSKPSSTNPCISTSCTAPQPEALTTVLLRLRKTSRIISRVPQSVRIPVAKELTRLMSNCVSSNTVQSWSRLLTFSNSVLVSANTNYKPGSSPSTSLTARIRQNLALWCDSSHSQPTNNPVRKSRIRNKKKCPNFIRDRLVEAKVANGNIRGAVKIISSSDVLAPFTQETLDALRLKHPVATDEPVIPSAPPQAPLTTTAKEVIKIIRNFPSDSAAGPDGLRPDHLKDLTTKMTGTAGTQLIEALTNLTNLILAGEVPDEICPVLYGASLVALNKKDGGIRPIAVGSVFRRIVGRLACKSIAEDLCPILQPHQLGFATESACEAIVHAARKLMNPNDNETPEVPQCEVFVKLDYDNAFNSVDRTCVLHAAHDAIPHIFPTVRQAYGSPSHLFFGANLINSEVGIQQGDPLGPALFCIATNKLIRSLKSPFNAWYLDDGSLGGSARVVLRDLEQVIHSSAEIGLTLNPAKCELLIMDNSDPDSVEAISALLPGLKILRPAECELLGAPISDEALVPALKAKIESISRLVSRLSGLQSHTALFLLKNCLAIPKLIYTLRSAPAWRAADLLAEFDFIMRQGLEKIINVSLDDSAWLQASLPVSHGGIGIRCVESLSFPAYLASTGSTSDLVSSLLAQFLPIPDPARAQAMCSWTQITGFAQEPDCNKQRMWDLPVIEAQSAVVMLSAESLEAKARMLAVQRKESGAWLTALPSPNLGNLLDNASLRIAVCLRLGAPICHPHTCRCGSPVDKYGNHGLSCRMKAGTFPRHCELNDILKRALASANVNATLEPAGLSRDDGKAPDGLTLVPWSKGKCLVWDATCADTTCKTYLQASSRTAGAAAERRENYKRTHYNFLGNNYIFCPFAVETLGTFGEEALNLVKELGHRIHIATGEPRSRLFLTQRISIAIQRGNSIGILATLPPSSSFQFHEIHNL